MDYLRGKEKLSSFSVSSLYGDRDAYKCQDQFKKSLENFLSANLSDPLFFFFFFLNLSLGTNWEKSFHGDKSGTNVL